MGGLGGVFILGDMGLEYGNEKRVCTPFDVVLAFFVSVLIVLKFVGEYGKDWGSAGAGAMNNSGFIQAVGVTAMASSMNRGVWIALTVAAGRIVPGTPRYDRNV